MKTIFLGIIVLLPCLLIFNESDHFIINIIGAFYIAILFLCAKMSRKFGKFLKEFCRKVEHYNEKIFKI